MFYECVLVRFAILARPSMSHSLASYCKFQRYAAHAVHMYWHNKNLAAATFLSLHKYVVGAKPGWVKLNNWQLACDTLTSYNMMMTLPGAYQSRMSKER